jgi:DNA-binding MarR family transcriptional regulator
MTVLLQPLEARGLVERTVHEDDVRDTPVPLTRGAVGAAPRRRVPRKQLNEDLGGMLRDVEVVSGRLSSASLEKLGAHQPDPACGGAV